VAVVESSAFNNHQKTGVVVDGHGQTEVGMLRVEQATDVRGTLTPKGELNFMLNDGGTQDSNMQKPLAFTWNAVTKQIIPLGSSGGSQMWSPNRRYLTQQQDDGNLVQYDMLDPNHPKAIWSSWTGFIK
jgi:hypothetical protein